MESPKFKPSEVIYSKSLMGRVAFAFRKDNEWYYELEAAVGIAEVSPIKESEILRVWRNGKWWGK